MSSSAFKPSLQTPGVYTWTFPGAPIRIKIPYQVMRRLRSELDERQQSLPNVEMGGVLIGRAENAATLIIEDYVWITSEQQGTRYSIDPSQLDWVCKVYRTPVGYFRTQAGGNMRLREDEAAFLTEHFPKPDNVALLISSSDKIHTGGFFFWMEKGVLTPFSIMDFPLDADLLEIEDEPEVAPLAAEPTARLVLAEKWEAPKQAEPPRPSPPPEPQRSSPVLDQQRFAPTEVVRSWKLQPASSGTARGSRPSMVGPPPPAAPPAPRIINGPKKEKLPVSERVLVAAIFFTILGLTGIYAFIANSRPAGGGAAFPLQLNVEARGSGLNIWWNPQSAAIGQAEEGRLLITEDSQQTQTVRLGPKELAIGHVYYRSSGERIQLQMETMNRRGVLSKESVFAFSATPNQPAKTTAQSGKR